MTSRLILDNDVLSLHGYPLLACMLLIPHVSIILGIVIYLCISCGIACWYRQYYLFVYLIKPIHVSISSGISLISAFIIWQFYLAFLYFLKYFWKLPPVTCLGWDFWLEISYIFIHLISFICLDLILRSSFLVCNLGFNLPFDGHCCARARKAEVLPQWA